MIATIVVFSKKLKGYFPNIKNVEKQYFKDVVSLGVAFFWLQLMSLIMTSTNEVLIAWLSGTDSVVLYQIYFKIFYIISSLYSAAMIPVWSAVTKAKSENNFLWIKKLYSFLKLSSGVFVAFEILMIFILQYIIDIWLGDNSIKVNYTYALVFAISGGLYIWHSSITSIVNGMGKLKIQTIFLTVGGVLNIPVAIILYMVTSSWISIVIANIISLFPYAIVQPFYIGKFIKKGLGEKLK